MEKLKPEEAMLLLPLGLLLFRFPVQGQLKLGQVLEGGGLNRHARVDFSLGLDVCRIQLGVGSDMES